MFEQLLSGIGDRAKMDWEFLGIVPQSEFITYPDLVTLTEVTVGVPINQDAGWLKFAKDGKHIYIAQMPIRSNINWNTLNTGGLVLGKDVEIRGIVHTVRLLTGGNAPNATAGGGEWNKFMYDLSVNRPANYPYKPQAELTNAELGIGSGFSAGRSNYCRENHTLGGGYCVNRGFDDITTFGNSLKTVANANSGWRPIIVEV